MTVIIEFVSRRCVIGVLLVLTVGATQAQTPSRTGSLQTPTHDLLRGEYSRYRANNDLLSCDLDIRVNPDQKFVSGRNTIRFRMLKDDTRIHLDLYDSLKVEQDSRTLDDREKAGLNVF